jgi:hypothetical protein
VDERLVVLEDCADPEFGEVAACDPAEGAGRIDDAALFMLDLCFVADMLRDCERV